MFLVLFYWKHLILSDRQNSGGCHRYGSCGGSGRGSRHRLAAAQRGRSGQGRSLCGNPRQWGRGQPCSTEPPRAFLMRWHSQQHRGRHRRCQAGLLHQHDRGGLGWQWRWLLRRTGHGTRQGCWYAHDWHVRLPLEVRFVRQGFEEHVHKGLGFFLKKDVKLIQTDLFELLLIFVLFHKCHDILCKGSWVGIAHVF